MSTSVLSPESALSEEHSVSPIAALSTLDVIIDTPVDELGQIIMHAVDEVDQRIQYVIAAKDGASTTTRRRFTPTHASRGPQTQSHPSMSHDDLFDNIRARVHEYCFPSESGLAAQSLHPTFQHLTEIHRILRTILAALSRNYDQVPLPAIQLFFDSAKGWLGKTEDRLRDTTVGSDDGLLQESISPAVATTASATGTCPIEDGMISLGYGNKTEISLFTSWALERKPTRADSLNQFGSLRDARLYRSRKKPFNHEYILLRFLNMNGVESWVRLERAARLGRHPYAPRRANFGPLTTGVTAKDTVSFSTAHEPLSSNSDEVAAVSLRPPSHPSASQILLEDLAQIIFRTTATNPLYQLFTVNCRWFARRLYLTSIQWCQSANIAHEITWRGHPSNLSLASQKLQKEWFGGAHIEGGKGMRLRFEHMLALAVRLLDCGDAQAARPVCEDALDTIEGQNDGSEKDNFLLAYVLVTLGDAIVMMGEPFAALPQLQRACDVVRPLVDTRKNLYAHTLARYAHALCACGRVPEACAMQGEAVDLTRALGVLDFEPVRDKLSLRLHDLGTYQVILEQYAAACVSFEEAITIRSILHVSHPSRYLQPLFVTLSHYADALNSSSRSHEAVSASRKAVSLTRLAYTTDAEGTRQELAGQLYNLAQYLRHNDDPEALSTAREALDLRRKMCEIAPGQRRLSLLSSLQQCAAICSDHCNPESACAYCQEAVEILRELRREDKDDITLRDQLSTTLCNAAYCLAATKDSQAAADCFREATELDREGYVADPANYSARLAETLLDYAEHLESMEGIDEASQVRSELERIRSQ